MKCEEVSNFMGIIKNTENLIRMERNVWADELDAMERRYEREAIREGFPDKERERLERRMGEVQQILKRYNRAIFGLYEAWNNLEEGKMFLDKISDNH